LPDGSVSRQSRSVINPTVSLGNDTYTLNDQRDGDTWAIHLMDLQKQGFNPDRIFADDGSGLRAGH
jgi:hypothetical protein